MAGKRGRSGGWNKREEWDWRELLNENREVLVKLAKRVRIKAKDFDDATIDEIMSDRNKSKLFFKALDIGTAICLKGMPTKLEGEGIASTIQVVFEKNETNSENSLQAPRFATPDIQR